MRIGFVDLIFDCVVVWVLLFRAFVVWCDIVWCLFCFVISLNLHLRLLFACCLLYVVGFCFGVLVCCLLFVLFCGVLVCTCCLVFGLIRLILGWFI